MTSTPLCAPRRKPLAGRTGIGALLLLALLAGRPLPAAVPAVSIPRDAPLPLALAALQQQSGGAVLAEAPQVDRRLPDPIQAAPPAAALEEISRSYHLYVISRPGSIAFQRRFGDGRDDLLISREEATAALSDLARLALPFWPGITDVTVITDQRDFFRSLSRDQTTRMQEGGLPFSALRPEQQRLWLKINARQAFGTSIQTLLTSAAAVRSWDRADFGWTTRPVLLPGGAQSTSTRLRYSFPDPHTPGDLEMYNVADRYEPQQPPPYPPTVAGEQHPPRAGLPEAFEAPIQYPPGETTLTELVRAIEAATEREIRVPAYAREWRLLAYVPGATAQEVLGGLEDLYGWRLQHQEGRRYALRRPVFPAAHDVVDLYQKMWDSLPPPAKRLLAQESIPGRRLRLYRQVETFVSEAQKRFGRGWAPVKPAELGPQAEALLFDHIFEIALRRPGSVFLPTDAGPLWWVVAPEQGLFTLEGDPARQPLIQFHVRRPDGIFDAWGWLVGSNSLGE
jgi:hypothetical protein